MTISVNSMRAIDHWVGVPLCAIASPLVALLDAVKNIFNRGPGSPKKLLFIELSEMGSAILVDPAMRNAQARGAELFFLIFKSNRASLTLLNTVKPENVFTIDSSSLSGLIKDTLRFLIIARRHRIDTVIDLELFSRFTALLTGLCGARRRVGYHIFHGEGLWRGFMLTRKVHYNPHIHITKNFLSLIHAAFAQKIEVPFSKIQIPDSEVRLEQAVINPAALEKVRTRIEKLAKEAGIEYVHGKNRLILINPNASDLLPQRRWAQQRFSELIQGVHQQYPSDLILITGSPAEIAYVEKVRAVANIKNALNFAGQVSFAELPPLYTLSDVMVTNDSGPGHFSAVTPLRTVVLFGPETPALYGSVGNSIAITANLACSPCVSAANHRKTPCHDNVCMQAITVAQVLEKVSIQLQDADKTKGR
ncbi:glycosyltransferase family 9 protein [Polynucleobacter sp. MG-5-Ahmo-C2]|uniref:glycosyltransferase family 9 protein n=1 Tax=unclassified Polynucleobacter TaxID=2640945 RepID=UPI001BFD64E2|nr:MULTISPECIES: glycosyltransferase family 9 protein [unclassified Polynucleobacter]QWD72934.1 glycosyltransferase family 9 protein [Polynucleobacter sp. UB-Raua-W9]QWD99022.1 glycosyltransferase family 9 protein [Polynucleobacter sp. MG-5-Ahmo-C2]